MAVSRGISALIAYGVTPMSAADRVVVRPVGPGDAEALVAVYDTLGYPATAAQIGARLDRIGRDPSYRTWVAELEGQAAGIAGARVGWFYEHDGAHVQLLALAVTDRAQGHGVGGALLAEVEAWARHHNATAVILHSGRQRTTAHAFYRAHGYADTGLRFVKRLEPHLRRTSAL